MALIVPVRPNQYPWDLLLLADPCRGLVEKYLRDALVLASTDRGEILGVVVITSLSHSSWEIKNLAVSPAHQGRGLGKALLRSALDLSKSRGAHEVWIGTGNSSLNQLGLYQRMGFRMVEIVQDFFTQHYAEEIVENGIPCRDMVRLVMTFPMEES
jgi:ribosomal protein S18 acetylase RimI-like enzyme